jgi:hypothetical protein
LNVLAAFELINHEEHPMARAPTKRSARKRTVLSTASRSGAAELDQERRKLDKSASVRFEKIEEYREWLDALQRQARLSLLLAGGDKSTQQKDISRAILSVKNYQE